MIERNLISKEKIEMYLGNKIVAWKWEWEEFNEQKHKWVNKKEVMCHLYRIDKMINLGECNNGDKFNDVNQAINQAKDYVNACNDMGWSN